MATLTTELVTSSGLNATATAAESGGDKVRPGSIVRFINGGAAPVIVTMVTPGTYDGDLPIDDRAITVPNGESRLVAATDKYRSKADQLVSFTYDDVTSLTVEVFRA